MERFVGTLIENYAGAFPVWLAPVQVKILHVSEKHMPYVKQIRDRIFSEDIRVVADEKNNTIGYQIREAHNMKVPYSIIIGDKEVETNTISVRDRKQNQKNNISLEDFLKNIHQIIDSKSLDLWTE